MKKILYILLAGALILVSCKNRKEAKKAESTATVEEVVEKKEIVKEEAPIEVMELADEEKAKMVLISLSKSVCFGECPSFDFTVYANGTAIYHGKKFVKRKGKYKAIISAAKINQLLNEASDAEFFSLKDKYDNEYITDLPTVTTFLNYGGKEKKVICRYECDKRIEKVNIMIENLIETTKWKQYE